MRGGHCSASSRYPSAHLPTSRLPRCQLWGSEGRRPESDRQSFSPPLTCCVTWGKVLKLSVSLCFTRDVEEVCTVPCARIRNG